MLNPGQGLLNMNKYRNLWRVFSGVRAAQVIPPLLTPNLDRMTVLRVGVIVMGLSCDSYSFLCDYHMYSLFLVHVYNYVLVYNVPVCICTYMYAYHMTPILMSCDSFLNVT